MFVVSRPAMAMATSGSPVTTLAYQSEVKPSASACWAWRTTLSTVALPPVRPMRTCSPSEDAVRLYNSEDAPGASMDIDAQLEDLRHEVRLLKDRGEILDCIARHARGCDRHDVELLTSTYHEDSVDEHGATVNAGTDYALWA